MATARMVLMLSVTFTAAAVDSQAQPLADLNGRWATQGFGSIVEFHPCSGAETTMCGRIVWLWDENDTSARCRTDPHNPDDGRTYTGTVRLQAGRLELRSCALSLFCQTQTSRRPLDVPAASESSGRS